MGVCNCSIFCCTLLYVHSSIATILMGKRERLLGLICLPGVSWWLSCSSSRCHGVVCGLWLWYFLIILTYYLRDAIIEEHEQEEVTDDDDTEDTEEIIRKQREDRKIKMNERKKQREIKVSNGAKIRNRYNQVPHLTQDTNGKVTNSQKTPQTRAKRSALSQQVTTKHI